MAPTSGTKRPLGSPSPAEPPPRRVKREGKQEPEEDANKYASRDGKEICEVAADDPPPETSEEAQRRLVAVQDLPRIDESVLSRLQSLLLDVPDDNEALPNIPDLSAIVARISKTEGWSELLDNLLEAIHTNFETRQGMALRVLSCMPEKEASKFLSDNYKSLYIRFLELIGSPNLDIQALTFDASTKLISLKTLLRLDGDIERLLLKMFVWLQVGFHKGGQIDILEPRIMNLVVFARNNAQHFNKSLNTVLTCIFEIVETADINFIKCQAIEIFMILQEQNSRGVQQLLRKLSNEFKRIILEKCVCLMFCIADVPSWYDMDTESSDRMGISGNFERGKFLLHEVCLDSNEDFLFHFGYEMIPEYLNSEDWQTRHAGVIAFAAIARACAPDMIREQTERVLDISLADPHPRVRYAAIGAMLSSISDDTEKEHAHYLIKFLPRLVTLIRSSASIYPRIQLHATVAVRHLVNYCDDEDDVRSVSEDLVPQLLTFLKQGGIFRGEAMEILRLLAVSFPVIFRSHYQETVDSLKPLVSQWLLGAKSIECLSFIFSGFLRDQSLFVLSDTEKVFTIVFKILDDWNSINQRVMIHILKALSQLCKLPLTDELLNKTMLVLIQILENTKNTPTTTLTIGNKQAPTRRMRILACKLLSSFAVRFQEQFAPWASRVTLLLTSLFMSTNVDGLVVASVKAIPNVVLSCQHRKQYSAMINSTVRALVQASQEEYERENGIVMLKSLNACIAISGSVFGEDVIKQIVVLINQQLSLVPVGATDYDLELEEKTIQVATKCLETMINTLKSAFLPHVDELLPAVEALWSHDNWYPYKVKEVAISIFNLLLKDYPYKLKSYRDTFLQVVMNYCDTESPQLQREAARGIGLCATNTELIHNFDTPKAIDNLYHVIKRGVESEKFKIYDAGVSALGKICEFRHDIIDGPNQYVPIWLNLLPLRNDFEEAKYAHQQLCRLLEKGDPDLLGRNNENLDNITQILNKILLQNDYIATEETICSIISLLTQLGAMA